MGLFDIFILSKSDCSTWLQKLKVFLVSSVFKSGSRIKFTMYSKPWSNLLRWTCVPSPDPNSFQREIKTSDFSVAILTSLQ